MLAQSGLIGADPVTAPTHEAEFLSVKDEYRLAEGEDELVVPLRWSHPSGIDVIKRYRFRRGSYLIEVSQEAGMEGARDLALQMQADGKGKVLVFTGTPMGVPPKGQQPFWTWSGWPGLVKGMAGWLTMQEGK